MSWRKCSTCKKEIDFGSSYLKCNVSTCNRKRTGMVFCSEPCWDSHVPVMNHRESWAVEAKAPTEDDQEKSDAVHESSENQKQRRLARPGPEPQSQNSTALSSAPKEVLIVASRLKAYVKARSGMNTSDTVLGPLSEIVRKAVDEAIGNADADERKTVLERDVRRS
jgi:hypothetical protein